MFAWQMIRIHSDLIVATVLVRKDAGWSQAKQQWEWRQEDKQTGRSWVGRPELIKWRGDGEYSKMSQAWPTEKKYPSHIIQSTSWAKCGAPVRIQSVQGPRNSMSRSLTYRYAHRYTKIYAQGYYSLSFVVIIRDWEQPKCPSVGDQQG